MILKSKSSLLLSTPKTYLNHHHIPLSWVVELKMKKREIEIEIEKVKKHFLLVKQNLSEHLSAINENTSELHSFFDYLQELDQKIEKLSQRIDQIQLQNHKEKPYITPLNATEKKIFLALYTEETPLNCLEISQKTSIPLSIIREHLTTLSQKGIPLTRSFVNNQTFYQLDQNFKEWQAKNNIINLSLDAFTKQNFQTKLKTYIPKTFKQ